MVVTSVPPLLPSSSVPSVWLLRKAKVAGGAEEVVAVDEAIDEVDARRGARLAVIGRTRPEIRRRCIRKHVAIDFRAVGATGRQLIQFFHVRQAPITGQQALDRKSPRQNCRHVAISY